MDSASVRLADSLDRYAGRHVFVTGHTGFKGAWLSLWLQHLGARTTGYALAPEARSLFETSKVAGGMTSIIGDVRNRAFLESAMREAAPEIVIHMAAQSLVRRSYDEPVETYEANVMGTAHVLDCVRRQRSVKAVVIVTSDKCYENHGESAPFTEDSPMGGRDPYSSSKGCAELVTRAYAASFFADDACAVASARAGNVIGGGDWAVDRIIPDLMRAAETRTRALIRRPGAVRPWQHVLEPLRGYLLLAQRLADGGRAFAGAWNFGPRHEDAVPVRDIAEAVMRAWPEVVVDYACAEAGPHEAASLRLDCAKAEIQLGWKPALTLADAIDMTVGWYRGALGSPSRAEDLAGEQIRKYERCLEP